MQTSEQEVFLPGLKKVPKERLSAPHSSCFVLLNMIWGLWGDKTVRGDRTTFQQYEEGQKYCGVDPLNQYQ